MAPIHKFSTSGSSIVWTFKEVSWRFTYRLNGSRKGRGLARPPERVTGGQGERLEVFGEPDQEGVVATSMPILAFRAISRWQGQVSVEERTFSLTMRG